MMIKSLPPTPRARPGKTVEDIVGQIADAIVEGKLKPGERLDEIGLAGRYAVSRTPIREALGQLSAMGLVARRPNRGAVVAELSPEHLANLIEAMAELEAVCARLAAERMTGAERKEMEAAHLYAADYVRRGQGDAYNAHDHQFHAAVHAGARNPHLREMVALARARLTPFRADLFANPTRLARSFSDHDCIVTAILQADGAQASELMRAHVLEAGQDAWPAASRRQ